MQGGDESSYREMAAWLLACGPVDEQKSDKTPQSSVGAQACAPSSFPGAEECRYAWVFHEWVAFLDGAPIHGTCDRRWRFSPSHNRAHFALLHVVHLRRLSTGAIGMPTRPVMRAYGSLHVALSAWVLSALVLMVAGAAAEPLSIRASTYW